MIDMTKHELVQKSYDEFLSYVKSVWSSLLENDWVDEPTIKKVVVTLKDNDFVVFVTLNENKYYEWDCKKGVYEVEYTGKPIKTGYTLPNTLITYMLLNCDVLKDLGLSDDVEFVVSDVGECMYFDDISVDDELNKRLYDIECAYAYDWYCREHDL